jgi:hypothetical protein
MSCNCNSSTYSSTCCPEVPYPSISSESVPSLIDNLVYALYGTINKTIVNGRVVWNIPCDPANDPATIDGFPREEGEGLLCYIIRYFNFIGPITIIGDQPKGGGTNRLFYENDIVMTANYTITSGKNAMSAGPITVNPGVTLTVPSGSVYTIV